MPDVIIKGMEMPESCKECCLHEGGECHAVEEQHYATLGICRPDWCPLRPAPEWISVEERLPESGERVILQAGAFVGEGYLTTARTWWRITGVPMRNCLAEQPITHWMPLPEPPKG